MYKLYRQRSLKKSLSIILSVQLLVQALFPFSGFVSFVQAAPLDLQPAAKPSSAPTPTTVLPTTVPPTDIPTPTTATPSPTEIITPTATETPTPTITTIPTAGASADLDQCANGKTTDPQQCTGSAWHNGNLNQNQAHYYEGDAIPYRLVFDDVSTTGTHTVTIEWDTTKNGKHAIDYLTTYNQSETNAYPCSDVPGCDPAVFTTYAVPDDPNSSVTQVAGLFTLFGGTITGVSAYTLNGSYSGDSSTRITISFTSTVENPVLAWGGHVASQVDWGTGSSAVNIAGSPYHMRLLDINSQGGNQDRSLSVGAIIVATPTPSVSVTATPSGTITPTITTTITPSPTATVSPTITPIPTTSTVTICKNNVNGQPLSGWRLTLRGTDPVESLFAPASNGAGNGNSVVTSTTFAPGDYVVRASGTYIYRPNTPGATTSDAGYSQRDPSDAVYGGPYVPWVDVNTFPSPHTGYLGIMINDTATPWGYYNPEHIYLRGYEDYVGGSLDFTIKDDIYSDNSGGLNVDIYAGWVRDTQANGCATIENVPFGTYTFEEMLQMGWTYVSGAGTVVVDSPTETFTMVNANASITPTATPTATLTPMPTNTTTPTPTICPTGTVTTQRVETFTQGNQKNGATIPAVRSNPTLALGNSDGQFVSLGLVPHGSLTLEYTPFIANNPGDDISIYEVTNGRPGYPEENAKVEVSMDGVTWYEINKRAGRTDSNVTTVDISDTITSLPYARYVRLTDETNVGAARTDGDGFDVDAVIGSGQYCGPTITPTITVTPTVTDTITPTATATPVPAEIWWYKVTQYRDSTESASPLASDDTWTAEVRNASNSALVGQVNNTDISTVDAFNNPGTYNRILVPPGQYTFAEIPQSTHQLAWGRCMDSTTHVPYNSTFYYDVGQAVAEQQVFGPRVNDLSPNDTDWSTSASSSAYLDLSAGKRIYCVLYNEPVSPTPTQSITPSPTLTATPTATLTPNPTVTVTPIVTSSPTPSPTQSPTVALIIQKSNNATTDKTPGANVQYTIKVTADNDVDDVIVRDLPPDGFRPRNTADWTVTSSVRGRIDSLTGNPNYSPKGTWKLGDMKDNEVVSITYTADISSGQEPGRYPDLAWAYGASGFVTSTEVRATGTNSQYVNGNFVGTQVNIVREQQSTASINVEKEEKREVTVTNNTNNVINGSNNNSNGQVLGASTSRLPSTGAKTIWVVLASLLSVIGIAALIVGLTMRKTLAFVQKHSRLSRLNNIAQAALSVLLFIGIVMATTPSVYAAAGDLTIRLEQQKSPTNLNSFSLVFVTLDITDRPITVKCFKKGPNENSFTQFGPDIAVNTGGTTTGCNINSSIMSASGTYQFYTSAQAGSDNVTSNTIAIDYNTSGPGTPVSYNKTKTGSCEYTIKFKTAEDGGKTKKVELYRSETTSFSLDAGTRVQTLTIGSNQEGTFVNGLPDCNKTYYYAIRTYDEFGNGSGAIGDSVIKITEVTTVVNTTTTTTNNSGSNNSSGSTSSTGSTTTTSSNTSNTSGGAIAVNNANVAAEGTNADADVLGVQDERDDEEDEETATDEADVLGESDSTTESAQPEPEEKGDVKGEQSATQNNVRNALVGVGTASLLGLAAYAFIRKNRVHKIRY